jgi:chromosome partitioning protein
MSAPKKIAAVAQKGGGGKSTTVTQLATCYSLFGLNVLVINTDLHQDSVGDVLSKRNDPNITCITISNKNLRNELNKNQLLSAYDIILIDGEGNMNEFSRVSLEVCDYFILPMKPSQFDLNSYARYVGSVIEPVLALKDLKGGILINEDHRKASTKETIEAVAHFEIPVFNATIPHSEYISKASGRGLSVAEFRTNDPIVDVYFNFVKELNEAADVKIPNFKISEFKKRAAKRKALNLEDKKDARHKDHQKALYHRNSRLETGEFWS